MRLLSYSYKDFPSSDIGWNFSSLSLKKVNLFVGITGSGKSRLINTLCNVAEFIYTNNTLRSGVWDISFKIDDEKYRWYFEGRDVPEKNTPEVVKDCLWQVLENGDERVVYNRSEESFEFQGTKLPKLPRNSTGIYLLKEEELIAPIHREFGKIQRRSFFSHDLMQACSISNAPNELMAAAKGNKSKFSETVPWNLPLNIRLYALRETDIEKFKDVIDQFKTVFPTIESIDFTDGSKLFGAPPQGRVPVLTVKENKVGHPVMLHDLSTGMQKVLLIITDVITMLPGSVHIIDEYENSLGVNAINFLPGLINDFGEDSQFIVISHHPYLINRMPITSWQVFHRIGSEVKITPGEMLKERYGASKQEAFIQLMNDPEFLGSAA